MKPIRKLFPNKCKRYAKFGFMRGEQYADAQDSKIIGFLSDFKLPEKHLEIIVREMLVDPESGFIGYVPKDRNIPENVPPQYIDMNTDNLVRRIIKDPIVYTKENVFTESKIDKMDGSTQIVAEPMIYIGHKRVVICSPAWLLGVYIEKSKELAAKSA